MNTLRDHLGRAVTIDEDRVMTLRFLKHGCPDGEYSIEGPGIDMTFYRIDGIVFPSGGTIDGFAMPARSRAECIETFWRESLEEAPADEAAPCMDYGDPVPEEDRTVDPVDGAILCDECADDRAEQRLVSGDRSVEGLMAQRKAAFGRWAIQGFLTYRGEDVSLVDGPDQDKIGYHSRLYHGLAGLTEVLRHIDELNEEDPEFRGTVERAWEEWLGSEECRRVYDGEQAV
jgi:hypothetical protein